MLLVSIVMYSQNPADYRFIENKGQLADIQGNLIPEQEYYVNSGPLSTYFSTNGFDVVYSKVDDDTSTTDTLWRVNGHFLNSHNGLSITPKDSSSFFYNYYLPQCPNELTQVYAFSGIEIQELYSGISVEYNSTLSGYSMLFALNPERMPETIDIEFVGQDSMQIDTAGNLHVYTGLGEVLYPIPNAWYDSNSVSVSYTKAGNIISFSTANYIGSDTLYMEINRQILIPQLCSRNLVWSTYLGGSEYDRGNGICADTLSKDIYITGSTYSADFPVSTGGIYIYNGMSDIFIAKFNQQNKLLWSGFYGGSMDDIGNNIVSGDNGYVYVCGKSTSNDIPLKFSALQYGQIFGLGLISRFSKVNGLLDWSTKYGGKGPIPYGGELTAIDYYNNKILTVGYSNNDSVPTLDLNDSSYYSDSSESGILLVFKNNCTRYYCTKYGDPGALLKINDLTHDINGNVFIVGTVHKNIGSSIPIIKETTSSYDQSGKFNGGISDGFIAKFGPKQFPTGKSNFTLLWSCYFGGNRDDEMTSIIVADKDSISNFTSGNGNNIYVGGATLSDTFPILKSSAVNSYFDSTYYSTLSDLIIGEFSNNGKQLWTSYYGGICRDVITDLSFDPKDNYIVIVGTTNDVKQNDIELADNSYMYFKSDNPSDGSTDGLIIAFDTMNRRIFATIFGGIDNDMINAGCNIDSLFYITGYTHTLPDYPYPDQEGFPLCKENSSTYFQTVLGTNVDDAFISKFVSYGSYLGAKVYPDSVYHGLNMQIYPVPSHDKLYVELEGTVEGTVELELLNPLGQAIFRKSINKQEYKISDNIELGSINDGIYFIRIAINNIYFIRKIIKL